MTLTAFRNFGKYNEQGLYRNCILTPKKVCILHIGICNAIQKLFCACINPYHKGNTLFYSINNITQLVQKSDHFETFRTKEISIISEISI